MSKSAEKIFRKSMDSERLAKLVREIPSTEVELRMLTGIPAYMINNHLGSMPDKFRNRPFYMSRSDRFVKLWEAA